MFKRRLAFVLTMGGLYLLLLLSRLVQYQLVEATRWKAEAARLGHREIRLPARRGAIRTRDGVVLAEDQLQLDLEVRWSTFDATPWTCDACGRPAVTRRERPPARCPACDGTDFARGPERDLSALPALLGITPADLEARLLAAREEWRRKADQECRRRERTYGRANRRDVERLLARRWYLVAADLPEDVVRAVTLDPQRYRGLDVRPTYRRIRAEKGALRPLIGAVSGVYEAEATGLRRQGVGWAEIFRMRFGRSGLERSFESRLAAKEGRRLVDRDATGVVREVLEEVPARDGETVATSLSARLTGIVTEALGRACREHDAEGGAFVALDPRTGEVLVLAQWPADREDGAHLALTAVVPGSVFKVVTALAGLLSEELDPDEPFPCEGSWHGIRCHGLVHDRIGLEEAITHSCNGYFASAAERMGSEILAYWARELGFGKRTGLGLSGEDAGLVPDDAWKASRHQRDPRRFPYGVLHAGEVRQIGFGQGYLMVTPLQVARLMAVVASGGRDVTPSLVKGGAAPGELLVEDREALARVRRGLEEVVTVGTARTTRLGEFGVAGKTGTAEIAGSDRNMAWFAGYAPADEPRIAFACYLKKARESGARAAGPVVVRFLEEHLSR